MNRGEPTVHDVDTVDASVMDETAGIDWGCVSDENASQFGLALSLFRDAYHVHQQRRVAWGTASGGAISIAVVAFACLVLSRVDNKALSPDFVLGLIVVHQSLRAAWLYWKSRQAWKLVQRAQGAAVEVAHELARMHPTCAPQ